MGIYNDKIVEYVVVKKSGKTIPIVTGKEADYRLSVSSFLANRGGASWIARIEERDIDVNGEDGDFDIELNHEERARLEKTMSEENRGEDCVVWTGWRVRTHTWCTL